MLAFSLCTRVISIGRLGNLRRWFVTTVCSTCSTLEFTLLCKDFSPWKRTRAQEWNYLWLCHENGEQVGKTSRRDSHHHSDFSRSGDIHQIWSVFGEPTHANSMGQVLGGVEGAGGGRRRRSGAEETSPTALKW